MSDSTNRRVGLGSYFHQISVQCPCGLQSRAKRHDAELFAADPNDSDLASADLAVDANLVL
jgi:hypothetical protein